MGCAEPGCTRPVAAKGRCRTHYKREWSRACRPPVVRPTIEARFWSMVDRDGPVHPVLGTRCWVWTGARHDFGYGLLHGEGRGSGVVRAHRYSYELHVGPPGDLFVLHRCDNPPCVNPEHLRLGTNAENMRDMGDKGRSKFHKARFLGEAHGMSRLTTEQVVEMRRLRREEGIPYAKIATRFGVTTSCVFDVVTGSVWAHIPGAVPAGAGPTPQRRFTDDDVARMRAMRKAGARLRDVATEFGASTSCVWSYLNVRHGPSDGTT